MLKFSRNKLVSVIKNSVDTLKVHGVLDDDIYGLEIDLVIRLNDLKIVSIDGRWNRFTTPECPRAVAVLQSATKFYINEELAAKVHKIIGREGCRHFANLLIESCDAAKEAATIVKWQAAQTDEPSLTLEQFLSGERQTALEPASVRSIQVEAEPLQIRIATSKEDSIETANTSEKKSAGVFVDLHTHTSPASPCSSAATEQLIKEAKNIGLDGICLTDHNYVWQKKQVEELRQKHGFLILRGNEITTDQGDMLVFGMYKDIRGIIKLEDLKKKVLNADGFMIAAHPFRGFLVFGAGQLGLTAEKAKTRSLFQFVDAIEVLNGKVTEKENKLAAEVSAVLKLPATGGSDAHEVDEVGKYATRFTGSISNEKELLAALKNGDYNAVNFRKENAK
ncbi:MAG: PHP domain-containing protein [Thermodesulfobacteriota bacterium]|nr:PHP domain-containing protein [Thermodesulfobacteriota bacterium]